MRMQFGRHTCSGSYVHDGKCMYTSASGHIFDCSKFICGIHTDRVISCVQEVLGICGI